MKNLLFTIAVFCLFTACQSQAKKQTTENKQIDLKSNQAEVVFSSNEIRPGNIAFTKSGRIFASMTPLVGPKTKVFELNANGKNTGVAYPNTAYAEGDNSIFKAVVGIRTDSKDNLYILDMGAKQFVIWDTKAEKLVKKIPLPENVLVPTSFLQDFAIDEKHNRLIIADMSQGDLKSTPLLPAFIVVDIETGKSKRMAQAHPSMLPETEGGYALNPIVIDQRFEYVYFGALNARTIYRVPAASFDNEETLKSSIEKYGTKSFCDGIAIDADDNIYVTNLEKSEIGVYNKKDGFKTLATLPEGQSWPDGLYVSNGYVYGAIDQLDKTPALNNGKDGSIKPFIIVRAKLLPSKKKSKIGFLVTLKAKKGKEKEARDFVASAVALAKKEPNTLQWFAFQIDESTYGVFDTFENEEGRQEHLHGKIAAALFSEKAKEIFEGEPSIQKTSILSYK